MGFFGEEETAEEITEESVTQEEASPAAEDMFIEATSSEEAGHDTQELEAEDNPPTSVPLQELITERRKRQDIEAEIQQQTQNSAPKEEVPDPDEDPLGHANYKINRLESQLRGVAQQAQRQQHQQQQQAQQNAASTEQQGIVGQSQNLQTQFAASNPDYWDAYQFLENTRTQELTAMGYNDSQAAEVVANERGMIVTQSLIRDQNGTVTGWKHNPAEVAYKLAKMRGFAAPAPAAPVVAQVSGQDKFNMAATGSVAGASVGSSGSGAPASGAPTLESIANMSDKDFEKFSRTNPGIIETLLSHG